MEQYIPKSALLAEIKRLRERFIAFHHRDGNDWSLDNYGKMRAYNEVLSSLDTLEVKEVDLGLEIALWANAIPKIRYDDVERLAKYFFELGIKAQKGE